MLTLLTLPHLTYLTIPYWCIFTLLEPSSSGKDEEDEAISKQIGDRRSAIGDRRYAHETVMLTLLKLSIHDRNYRVLPCVCLRRAPNRPLKHQKTHFSLGKRRYGRGYFVWSDFIGGCQWVAKTPQTSLFRKEN